MNRKELFNLITLTNWVSRYEAYCMFLTAHVSVAPPRNGTTIPSLSRLALPCEEHALHLVQLPDLG